MGIFDKIKRLAEPGPAEKKRRQEAQTRKATESFERKQLQFERHDAYMVGLKRGTLERARREGYKKGRAGSGLSVNVGSAIKTIGRIGQGAQGSLNAAFGDSPFSPPKRRRPEAMRHRRSNQIVIRVEGSKTSSKRHKKKSTTTGPKWWEL
jgi:hypothetical protein